MTKVFSFSREKDENELLKQMIASFSASSVASSQTLHPLMINYAFCIFESMYLNYMHRLRDDKIIKSKIDDFKKLYAEAMGMKPIEEPGADRNSLTFLYNLNEKLKDLYYLFLSEMTEGDKK